jgi:branched-chain amino acid transport system substrate-binding protein
MNRKFLTRGLAVICACSFIAAACGDDSGTTSTAASSPAGETTVADSAAPTETTAAATETTAATASDVALPDMLATSNVATGEPIKVGWADDGKSASVDNSIDHVIADATVEYINKHLGGIGGRPIELVKCEILNDTALATDCGNKFVEQKVVAALMATSGLSGIVWDAVTPAGIPFICTACAEDRVSADTKSTFIMLNNYAGSLAAPLAFGKRIGAKEIVGLIIGMPAAVDPQEIPKAAAKALGMNIDIVSIPPGIPDATAQVTAALTKKPDLVYTVFDPAGCLTVLTALNDLGYKGTIQGFDYCVSSKVYEPLPAELKKSMLVQASSTLGFAGDKDYELYQGIMKKYAVTQPEVSGVRAWAYQAVMGFYLGVTGGKIDPKDVTAATVIAAMKAAPAQKMPLTRGNTFKCDGQAFPVAPSTCIGSATLEAVLDENANTIELKSFDTSEATKAISDVLAANKK